MIANTADAAGNHAAITCDVFNPSAMPELLFGANFDPLTPFGISNLGRRSAWGPRAELHPDRRLHHRRSLGPRHKPQQRIRRGAALK
jgi:hypothetical protein